MDDWPYVGMLEDYEIQDLAEKYGLLEPHVITEPCCEDCDCLVEFGRDGMVGETCYRLAYMPQHRGTPRDDPIR